MDTNREWFLKYDSKSLNSRHERKQKLYPFAIIKWIICFYQIFHQKPRWRPELFPDFVGHYYAFFIKRKLRKYLKNISLFLKKTVMFLLGAISEDFEVKSIISEEMITKLKIVFKEASCTGQPCYEENRVPKAKSLAHRNYNQVYIFISEPVLKQDKSY